MNATNAKILNRDFTHPGDGWYHLEPIGEHLTSDGRYLQVIDPAAVRSIVTAFNREAKAPGFAGMLIDHEHFRHQRDKESRAMGWLMEMQARDDGPYGKIRWTNTGREAVDGGDYRFFSTEYDGKDVVILNKGGEPIRIRPTRMAGLTLTNDPNNRGGRPITNRREERAEISPGDDAEGRDKTGGTPPQTKNRNCMNKIIHALGMPPETSEEAVVEKITTINNRNKDLEEQNRNLLSGLVETDLEKYSDRIKDDQKAAIREQLLSNRKGTLAILEAMKAPETQGTTQTQNVGKPIHNRADTKTPGTTQGADRQDDESLARQAKAEVDTYQLQNRCTFVQAHNAVMMKRPELFGLPARN